MPRDSSTATADAPARTTTGAEQLIEVRLDQLVPSRANPPERSKKGSEGFDELVESIRAHGILQPIRVRAREDGRFDVIFGHRRAAAAKLAGLELAPALLSEISDLELLELQLVENLQRRGLHPLEEAEGYERLIEKHGQDVDAIAARVGKSKGYVYQRLKLCALSKACRERFHAGELDASQALLVARVVGEAQQAKAWKMLAGGPLRYREAAELVRREFMLDLKGASFDPEDAQLVPKAGACSACPKRTGAEPLLFAEVKSEDVCTDSACFRGKVDAAFAARVREHQETGGRVLGKAAAAKLYPQWHGGEPGELEWSAKREWVDVDKPDPQGELGKKPVRKALGGELPKGAVLARDSAGGAHVLLPRKEARKALQAAGVKLPKAERASGIRTGSGDTAADKRRRERARAKEELDQAVRAQVHEAVVAALREKRERAGVDSVELLQELVLEFVAREGNNGLELVAARLELELPKNARRDLDRYLSPAEAALREWLAKAKPAERLEVLLELVVRGDLRDWGKRAWGHMLELLAKRAGVNLEKLQKDTLAKVEAERKAAAAAASKAPKTGSGEKAAGVAKTKRKARA